VQNGYSIYIVSKLLGHSSVTQTEIYAHLAPSPSLQILIDGLPDTE
jgi:site-specific recombinase XerD